MKQLAKKQPVLFGAILLAFGGLLAKVIGALYKIPLTNILGSNGMGLYYLVFPLYSLFLVIISSGTSLAVSRLVSTERINHNKKNEITIFKVALIYVFVLSVIFSATLIVLSEKISLLQGNINAKIGYFAIAPSIIFASIISVIRGFFQGQENMIPTLVNNVIEQVVKLVSGLLLANMFLYKGITFAVFGAVLAVTISEFCALVFIIIHYLIYKRGYIYKIDVPKSKNLTKFEALKQIMVYSLPATLTAVIIPITGFLDSFMLINILTKAGFSSLQATNLYGISNGIVNTLISLPVLFCGSLATAIVPNLSGLYSNNNEKEVTFKTGIFIKITWIIALPCFIVFLIYSPDIITILYSNGLSDLVIDEFSFSYKLLMLSSVSILYYAFLQTFTSILQSINKPIIPFVSMLVAVIVRIACMFLFVSNPKINIFGVAISNLVFLTVACLINLFFIKKYIKFSLGLSKVLISPICSAVISGIVMFVLRNMLININIWLYCIISAGVGLFLYVTLIILFKSFSKQEITVFKKKSIINNI